MEIMMLHEAVDKIKDEILLHLNNEMRKSIKLIENANEKLEIEIKSFELDCFKIDTIKKDLKNVFAKYEFKVNANGKGFKGDNLIDRLTSHNNVLHEPISLIESIKDADDEPREMFDYGESNTTEFNGFSGRDSKLFGGIPEPEKMPAISHLEESKEKLQSSFDPLDSIAPDPSDANFNKFLETELERIKKNFLGDSSSKIELQSESKGILGLQGEKRTKSIGVNKSPSSFHQLTYKQRLDELYKKGDKKRIKESPSSALIKPAHISKDKKIDFRAPNRLNPKFNSSIESHSTTNQNRDQSKPKNKDTDKLQFFKKISSKLTNNIPSQSYTPLFKSD